MITLLTDFGIPDLNKIRIPEFMINRELQTEIKEFNIKFTCPVSKRIFKNKFAHENNCIYEYCKLKHVKLWEHGTIKQPL